jgi:UDP-2,4-diacetamido-2,4,6-trideoxy-beta-L-altropyranose hydrolase
MKIFIITEGGKNIGLGHIMRCISIYQAFEEAEIQSQLIVNGDETVEEQLKDKNCEVFDWLNEQKTLFATIRNADIAFIDSYLADYDLYEKISNVVETAVYFDDEVRMNYPKGFVVNGAILAERMSYPERKGVTYLLGAQYAPLRKEFWDVPAEPTRNILETAMITFGGADIYNLTPKVLKLLVDTHPGLVKKVIIGKGFRNTSEVETIKGHNTELIYYPDATGMKKVMLESDVTISACGQTLYELARVGLPTIGVCVAQNQLQNIEGWRKSGFLEYVGWHNDENLLNNLLEVINKLMPYTERFRCNKIGRKYVDGKGAFRIAKVFVKSLPVKEYL